MRMRMRMRSVQMCEIPVVLGVYCVQSDVHCMNE
jgi:hypothetical protein